MSRVVVAGGGFVTKRVCLSRGSKADRLDRTRIKVLTGSPEVRTQGLVQKQGGKSIKQKYA